MLDLDGTLVDHDGAVAAALEAWLLSLGVLSTQHLADAWVEAGRRHFERWRAGEVTFEEQRRGRLRDFLPLIEHPVGGDADLDELFGRFLRRYEGAWQRFADAEGALAALARRQVPIAVLTNGTEAQQLAKLSATGLRACVGPVLSAEGLGFAKPDRRAYLAACEALALEPEQVLHVGDDYSLDVVAARDAGLRAVHLDRPGTGPARAPIRSLAELPGLLPHGPVA